MLEAGQAAPEFSLPDLDGKPCSLADLLRRGPAVLAFFKTTCPVCQFAFPYIERLHASPRKGGLQFLAISQDSPRDTREFMNELGCTFASLMDQRDTYPASNAYRISTVPSVFVVERDGRISHAWEGWVKADMETLARRLDAPLFSDDEDVPAWKAG
jgi:peroxiredoxin